MASITHIDIRGEGSSVYRIPMVGFGTYLLNSEEAEAAVQTALEVGYRHIDTAEYYNNHEGVTAAIEKAGVEKGDGGMIGVGHAASILRAR